MKGNITTKSLCARIFTKKRTAQDIKPTINSIADTSQYKKMPASSLTVIWQPPTLSKFLSPF
jgi:hypothetical protein